jgi:hypothetical protein
LRNNVVIVKARESVSPVAVLGIVRHAMVQEWKNGLENRAEFVKVQAHAKPVIVTGIAIYAKVQGLGAGDENCLGKIINYLLVQK